MPLPRSFAMRLAFIVALAILLRAVVAWEAREIYAAPASDAWLAGAPDAVRADHRADAPYNPYAYGYAMVMGTDMPKHVRYARQVLRGQLLAENATISPLAPLVVLPVLLLLSGGNLAVAMMLQGGIIGGGAVALTGLVGRRYLSDGGALLAALLAALYGPFALYDILPLTESTINLAALLAILLYLRLRERPGWGRAALFGLGAGLAIAAKPTLAVLPVCVLVGDAVERGPRAIRPLLPRLSLSLGVLLLVIAPFVARARLLTGEWLFLRGNTAYMVLMGNNPDANGTYVNPGPETQNRLNALRAADPDSLALQDRAALRLVLRWWWRNPLAALRLTGWKAALYLWPEDIPNNVSPVYMRQTTWLGLPVFLTPGILWPLGALGALAALSRARRAGIPLAFVLGYSVLIILTIVVGRLRLPVLPFLCMSGGSALVWLYHGGRTLDAARWRAVAVLAVLMLLAHGEGLTREIAPLLRPSGRRDPVAGGLLLRDGPWRHRFPYGVTLRGRREEGSGGDDKVQKRLLVSLPDEARPERVELWFWSDHGRNAVVDILINEHRFPVDLGPRRSNAPAGRATFLTRVPVSPAWLTAETTIRIRPRPGSWIRLMLDDGPWHGRSASATGGSPWQRPSDTETPHIYRHAHRPRGEFQVGLWFPSPGTGVPEAGQ